MMQAADPTARLLAEVRAWAASQGHSPRRQLRVTIALAKTETEICRLLVRPEFGQVELKPEPARSASPAADPLRGFKPTDLQRSILFALTEGPLTSGELADQCDVTTSRLFDRGKVLHDLIDRGLVVRTANRGYSLTDAGQAYVERLQD